MAHALRYYKEIQQENGQIIRLEIHRKDSTLPSVEIGRVLQALHLDIQGGADTIDAPIVKTSLTMTFVDAPDLEAGKKCGNWEEFYTPDSTMWKVVLKADGKTIWGGYVTPDSYQEDLRYRGSVTIIARDNIGHMQDFPFDMEGNADGMVTLEQLVNEAWAKIESPMLLDWRHEADDAMYLLCDGVEAPQTYMNVSAFEDMNFFDAVEKALYSYGLVMRYTGSNRVTIMSLRDLPYQGKSGAPRAIEPTFIAHAQRELAPAARRIEESVKYDFSDGVQIPLAKGVAFTGVAYTVPFYSSNVFGETTTKSIPVHAIANTDGEGWSNIPSSTLFFDPKKYTIRDTSLAEDAERMLFLACNTDGSHSAIYRKTVVCADFRINMTFGRPIERDSYGGVGYCYGFSDSEDREQNGIGSLSAKSVDCYISREQNGIQQFFDGHTWSADAVLLTIEVTDRQCGIDVPLGDSEGTAEVTLTIVDVRLNDKWDFSDGLGLYIPISSMYWGVAQAASLCETNNVNTVYVDTNNVILVHSPELAPALDEVPFPSVIKNGIFVKSGNAYLPAKGWAWSGGTPQQMAVYNHLQLLCYHSKPNNIISGDIAYADFVNMEAIYEWGGANHLLVSGSYNFLNGRIESAVLREFKFYTDMWSDVSGTSLPDTEQNNRTTAESGSGAAKASTYSNETTVNIGGSGGGGGTSGSSTLAGLIDVQVSSPSNGQALVYDSVSGMWMNKTIEKGDKVTYDTVIAALGYTPLNADLFTKANLGLGNVDNIAANKYFTALSSGTTNAVSMTIGGVTKSITAATLKASLNVLGVSENAASATKLKDNTAFTIWGNTFFTNGKPANVSNHLYMGNGKAIYFADSAGTNRMLCQVNTSNTALFGQGTASAGYDTYLNGHNVYIRTNYGNTIAMTLSSTGKVGIKKSPTNELDVDGEINSSNYMAGQYLSSAPLDSFATAIFGDTSSSYCRLRIQQTAIEMAGVAAQYCPLFAIKSYRVHGFISFGYNHGNKNKCYIGAGENDKINWSATLFHSDMSLIPNSDNSYTLGDSSKRWKEVHAVSIKIGDATITWDATAGMLKIDKGVYSIGAITAGGKGQSNKYRLDNWTEWDASDNKWQESSLSAKLGVDLHTRLLAIEESTNIGPVKIDLEYIRNTTTLTPSQALAAGLTEDVINNMLAGRYTKVIPDNDAKEVWDYTADGSGNSISIYLTNGDGFTLKSGIVIHRNSITDNWSVTYDEI